MSKTQVRFFKAGAMLFGGGLVVAGVGLYLPDWILVVGLVALILGFVIMAVLFVAMLIGRFGTAENPMVIALFLVVIVVLGLLAYWCGGAAPPGTDRWDTIEAQGGEQQPHPSTSRQLMPR